MANSTYVADWYVWTQGLWEHDISHYMYALGFVGQTCVYAWAFCDVRLPQGLPLGVDRGIWVAAILIQGLLIGAVAVEFPLGTIVVGVYLIVYGLGVVGVALYRRGDAVSWGNRYVLQFYAFSYVFALLLVIIWAGMTGLMTNRSASGIT